MSWFYQDPIDRLHHENLEFSRNQYRGQRKRSTAEQRLAWQAEDRIKERWGHIWRISPTVKNAPWDLWIEGVKVEVKASRWYDHRRGGRYQAAIRNHQADIVIFDCINGTDHFHIIPMPAITPRKNIAVWSYAPEDSRGQWVSYLEAWDYLNEAIKTSQNAWQLPLL